MDESNHKGLNSIYFFHPIPTHIQDPSEPQALNPFLRPFSLTYQTHQNPKPIIQKKKKMRTPNPKSLSSAMTPPIQLDRSLFQSLQLQISHFEAYMASSIFFPYIQSPNPIKLLPHISSHAFAFQGLRLHSSTQPWPSWGLSWGFKTLATING